VSRWLLCRCTHPNVATPTSIDGLPRTGTRRAADNLDLLVAVTVSASALSKLSPTVSIDGTAPIFASRSP
jgi:hypothetical protein